MNEKYAELLQKIKKEDNFLFSKNTTYGLGGRAKCAYYPETEKQTENLFNFFSETNERFVILGCGSNILASDKYFNGSVICTRLLEGIELINDKIYCKAGTRVSKILKFCELHGLGGLEYLAGIPASIGGIAYMNGGIASKHIEEDITVVRIFDGKMHDLSNFECDFSNKHSTMQDINCIICGVELKIESSTPNLVKEKTEFFLQERRRLPKGKSCGCVFKNPDGLSAGKVIDLSGLKGLRYGNAEVSSLHANFIINYGNSSRDVYELIKRVKSCVWEFARISLEEEVRYIGDFDDTFS